jgi:hypothetical protein
VAIFFRAPGGRGIYKKPLELTQRPTNPYMGWAAPPTEGPLQGGGARRRRPAPPRRRLIKPDPSELLVELCRVGGVGEGVRARSAGAPRGAPPCWWGRKRGCAPAAGSSATRCRGRRGAPALSRGSPVSGGRDTGWGNGVGGPVRKGKNNKKWAPRAGCCDEGEI